MSVATPATRPLDERELRAWRGMLQAHAALTAALDAELRERHDLPLPSYEVLMLLADAPEQRLRMAEIAERVILSRSGLTRRVDRLVAAGHVTRAACPEDGRGAYAQLTHSGAAKVREARATHLAGVRGRFLDRLDDEQKRVLGTIWNAVRSAP